MGNRRWLGQKAHNRTISEHKKLLIRKVHPDWDGQCLKPIETVSEAARDADTRHDSDQQNQDNSVVDIVANAIIPRCEHLQAMQELNENCSRETGDIVEQPGILAIEHLQLKLICA